MDIATSGMTNDQIKQFQDTPHTCSSCGSVGHPEAEYDAGYDENGMAKDPNFSMPVNPQTGQPYKPQPLTLFDVVVWVQREGQNTDSKPVIKNWCRITEAPFGDGGQPMDITQFVADLVKPFDFPEIFSTTPEEQAKAIGRPNPFGAQQQQQDFHQYAQQPQQGGYPIVPPAQPQGGYAPQPAGPPQQQPHQPIAAPYPPAQQPQQPQQPQGMPQAPLPPRPNWGNNQ